jgi:hypothetical protein
MFRLAATLLLSLFILCTLATSELSHRSDITPEFTRYWSQGKAEITRYALEQARYGEMRSGDAVLIFVTEDFLSQKQVKLETPPAGRPWLPVLKLNFTKKFATGIYPYSMMTSVFSPIDVGEHPKALKVSTSAQEWCGHVYTQLNLKGSEYEVEGRSYFEREGDQDFKLEAATLEDEIWTRIRLDPSKLPIGKVRMIPGTMAARLRHTGLDVEDAVADIVMIAKDSTGAPMSRYTITYPKDDRTLSIEFRTTFPHEIAGWSESYVDGFGKDAKRLTTSARRTHSMMIDYWNHHGRADDSLRGMLGLP